MTSIKHVILEVTNPAADADFYVAAFGSDVPVRTGGAGATGGFNGQRA